MKHIRAFYEKHFLAIELVISIVLAGVIVITLEFTVGRQVFSDALKDSRQGVYTTAASVTSSLLGFALAAVSIILVFGQMPRLKLLRESGQYANVFSIYFNAILWLGIAMLWSFIALIADTDRSPKPSISYGMLLFSIVAAFRVYRCVWILKAITDIAVRSKKE